MTRSAKTKRQNKLGPAKLKLLKIENCKKKLDDVKATTGAYYTPKEARKIAQLEKRLKKVA